MGAPNWSLHGFSEAAVARDGLNGIAALADQLLPRNNGDNMVFNAPAHIVHAQLITASLANTDQWRFRKTTERLYQHLTERVGIRCQTDDVLRENILDLGYPVLANDVITLDADNTNNAQVDTAGLWVNYAGNAPVLGWSAPRGLDIRYLDVTGGTTVTASAWSQCALTWPALETTNTYQIVGIAPSSATGELVRLTFAGGGNRPGAVAADIGDKKGMQWGDFGTFVGGNEPNAEYLCSAADTAQALTVAVVQV